MEIIRCGREKFDPLIEIEAINKLRNDGRDAFVASASSCVGPSAEEKQLDEANWVVFQANLNRDQKHFESTKQLMMLYDRRTLSALVSFHQEPICCSHALVARVCVFSRRLLVCPETSMHHRLRHQAWA